MIDVAIDELIYVWDAEIDADTAANSISVANDESNDELNVSNKSILLSWFDVVVNNSIDDVSNESTLAPIPVPPPPIEASKSSIRLSNDELSIR